MYGLFVIAHWLIRKLRSSSTFAVGSTRVGNLVALNAGGAVYLLSSPSSGAEANTGSWHVDTKTVMGACFESPPLAAGAGDGEVIARNPRQEGC